MLDELLNHPTGLGDLATFLDATPVCLDDQGPLHMTAAQIHCGVFEVPYAEVMGTIPASLHPSTPAYASLTFYRADDSEIGAFEYAVFGVACRSVIRPRMLTLSAFASGADAAAYLQRRWGFPCQVADVRTRQRYDGAFSELILDGRIIAQMETWSPEELTGASRAIRYPQPLNYAQVDDAIGLVQSDAAYEYEEAMRGKLKLQVFDAEVLSKGRVHPTDLVSGTFAKTAIEMLPAKMFVDVTTVGVVSKLGRFTAHTV